MFDLTGYKAIIKDVYFFKSLGTTLLVTVLGTTLNMVFSVVAAYVLSRKRLIGRKVFLSAILFTMLFSGGLIPTYLVICDLQLDNTIWSMILPTMISTYYLIIMKNLFCEPAAQPGRGGPLYSTAQMNLWCSHGFLCPYL